MVPDEHWDENLRLAKITAALAGSMGITLVNAHAGFLPHDPPTPILKTCRACCHACQVFGDHGVTR